MAAAALAHQRRWQRRRSPVSPADAAMNLFGFHSVEARLQAAPATVRELLFDRDRVDARIRALKGLAERQAVAWVEVGTSRLDRLAKGQRHQGVVAVVDVALARAELAPLLDRIAEREPPPLLVLLDGVTDPRNLGAVLRVADGAGADAVIAPRDHSCGLTEVAIHTSSGAAESVPYITVVNLSRTIEQLQDRGIRVLGASDEAAISLFGAELTGSLAWVLGAEGTGIRRLVREHCDALVSIPMAGRCHSLNVSVAAAVVLYESVRQRTGARRPSR
jgi:23S rRNA (guanosine2251-2'-O)-methyltransferase